MRNLPRSALPPRTSDAHVRDQQAERRPREPEQPSTYLDHVEDLPPGRFAKVEPQTVIGRTTPHPYPLPLSGRKPSCPMNLH